MQRHHSLFIGLLLVGASGARSQTGPNNPAIGASSSHRTGLSPQTKHTSVATQFGRLPLSFESNRGQTSSQVRFLTHTADSTLFLTPSEAVFSLPLSPTPRRKNGALRRDHTGHSPMKKAERVALRMQMLGADPKAKAWEQQPLGGQVSYFQGKDPRKWHAGIATFGRVGFHQVYPGVDLVYYGNQRQLEYDFVVAPHADPKQIRLHFAGADKVWVNAAGELIVRAQGQKLTWRKPTVYQEDKRGKHAIAAQFHLKRMPSGQSGVSFALGRYDTARPLIIDPVLTYSTYLGGQTANSNVDEGGAITVDADGNAYITGLAGSTDFPVTAGVYKTTNSGSSAFAAKLNPTGTALLYSTFVGPVNFLPRSIAVDQDGNAFITGQTNYADFPTTPGALQAAPVFNGSVYITKLNPTGTALVYSTFLGGSAVTTAGGLAIDHVGNAYITGAAHTGFFRFTQGAFQTSYISQSGSMAFVIKLNPTGTGLVYATLLGGSGLSSTNSAGMGDAANGIAIDGSGNAYVTGYTSSADFPITPGAFQTSNHRADFNGATNVFVTKLNAAGSGLVYSTFLGGSGSNNNAGSPDEGRGIAIDSGGNAYIAGATFSADFPTTPNAFQKTYPAVANVSVSFVTKLNPTGSSLIYSTFLGGSQTTTTGEQAVGIAVDSGGNAYIVGSTSAADFPTRIGSFQRKKGAAGAATGFLTKLNAAGSALLYSTFLGGSGFTTRGEVPQGIALDSSGNAYVTGRTYSHDFPTTPGAFQTTNHAASGGANAFVTKLPTVPIFPDFNNDGSTDLLLQNPSTGAIAGWWMQGARQIGSAPFSLTPPTEYALVGVGDFSGDGGSTLVLQSRVSNQIAFWYTSGVNHATVPGGNFVNVTPAANYKVVGVGDFNGDGKSDLVFQNQTTNQIAIWFMNGAGYQGGVLLPFSPLAGWKAAGTGDFNGDGQTDIVFQHQSTGQLALWYLNGTSYLDGVVLSAVPASGWTVVGVGDYNGDGYADLLFQNQSSNLAAVWHLINGGFAGGDTLSAAPPSGWKIVGPR